MVTRRKPTEQEWGELLFAMRVCKHVRSNAIVLANGLGTAGDRRRPDEPRRLGADRDRQGRRGGHRPRTARSWPPTPSSRSPTAPQLAIEAGVRAIIQPGGSQRDGEVIDACDEAGVAMVFTARRHFRH